jgi:hypothetical protein
MLVGCVGVEAVSLPRYDVWGNRSKAPRNHLYIQLEWYVFLPIRFNPGNLPPYLLESIFAEPGGSGALTTRHPLYPQTLVLRRPVAVAQSRQREL